MFPQCLAVNSQLMRQAVISEIDVVVVHGKASLDCVAAFRALAFIKRRLAWPL